MRALLAFVAIIGTVIGAALIAWVIERALTGPVSQRRDDQ